MSCARLSMVEGPDDLGLALFVMRLSGGGSFDESELRKIGLCLEPTVVNVYKEWLKET